MTDTEPDAPAEAAAECPGMWLRRAPTGPPHRCNTPTTYSDNLRAYAAHASAGDVWRCGCGRLWVCYIRVPNAHYSGRGMAEAGGTRTPTWRRGGLWLRVRYAEVWGRTSPAVWLGAALVLLIFGTIAILGLAGVVPPP